MGEECPPEPAVKGLIAREPVALLERAGPFRMGWSVGGRHSWGKLNHWGLSLKELLGVWPLPFALLSRQHEVNS